MDSFVDSWAVRGRIDGLWLQQFTMWADQSPGRLRLRGGLS
eukprot:SAG11_NODE_27406_length_333_cov_0.662393_1_plen_40_part_10